MLLYSLQSFELLWEEKLDTKVRPFWSASAHSPETYTHSTLSSPSALQHNNVCIFIMPPCG